MVLLWFWALVGTARLYQARKEVQRELAETESIMTIDAGPGELQNRYLERLAAFQGRGLPWPEEEAGVNLLSYLENQAEKADLTVMRMSLAPLEKRGAHKVLAAELELEGKGSEAVAFLVELKRGPYACGATGLELSAKEENLAFRVRLEFYLFNEKVLSDLKAELLARGGSPSQRNLKPLAYYLPHALDRAFFRSEKEVREEVPKETWLPPEAPSQTAEPKIEPQPEPYQPSYQLRGIVYQEKEAMAILEGAQGDVELVAKGAVLPTGEEVVAIEPRGVRLRLGTEEAIVEVQK